MPETFGDILRTVMLNVPMAPRFLAELWVLEAYRKCWEYRRPLWSFARAESAFATNASKSGTVGVTQDSKFVTGVGITFEATDEGRQFRAGVNQPVYSIECVEVAANTIELDRPYLGTTSAAASGVVFDGYITMPENFARFLAVVDPSGGWDLQFDVSDEDLNRMDPQRTSTGTPWALVSRRNATIPLFQGSNQPVGRIQYELWPYSMSRHEYWYFYATRPPVLSEDSEFPWIFRDRGDIIRKGALEQAAMWPGTEERKNPYFNIQLAKVLHDDFIVELAKLEVTDEDVYPTWWKRWDRSSSPRTPIDARYMQSHE